MNNIINDKLLDYDNYSQEGGDYTKNKKYIDLKINGRLFPTWVLANFKKYKLPEIMQDDDPCNKNTKLELRKYQIFLSKFLDYNSPYKNILIYHGLGSGKTRSAINIYNMLYNYNSNWNVFILLKATLKNNWLNEMDKWLANEDKNQRLENVYFISYDSPIADKQFLDAINSSDSSKNSIYIIEESHNFINNVYSNISSKQGRRALTIYEHIIQDKKDNYTTRVVLLSGTPAINKPFELSLLFNLLRPSIFPMNEMEFNELYITDSSYPILNDAKKNSFQRRILGLVSYYLGATPDYFASKKIHFIDIEMSKYHEELYSYFEEIEEKQARRAKSRSTSQSGSEIYKAYTRQSCNFVFPLMGQGVSGESRPRPGNFKKTIKISQKIDEGKENKINKDSKKSVDIDDYLSAVKKYTNSFDIYLEEKQNKDRKGTNTLESDINKLNKMGLDRFNEYTSSNSEKSHLFKALCKSSSKMVAIILNILKSPGPVLVYSNYVLMEGLEIFKIYLKYFGFSKFSNVARGQDNFRYVEYHGNIDQKERAKAVKEFNTFNNIDGSVIKIIMISPAGSEGISLENVRQVHIMEPHWHEVRINQMIGRAIRLCSHKRLPKKDRHVDVYRYKSIRKGTNKKDTTDQYIEFAARKKTGLIDSFIDAIKEASIDCGLYKNHNTLTSDYKCFQFEEDSLFDDNIGPAYKDDIYDDLKLDNGSNDVKSNIKQIKVFKIKAVQLISNPKDEPEYSNPEDYWYNPDSFVVYDYDLHYAIGKIGIDDDGLPQKLDNDTFIITKTILIPRITN